MILIGLTLLAFVAAAIASITGGTSLVTVPALIVAGLAPATAVATNMLVVTSLSAGAAARFRSAGELPLHPTLGLVVTAMPGSMLGAWIATRVSENFLRTTIAVAVVAMTALIVFQPDFGTTTHARSRARRITGYVLLGVWSIYGGMFSGGYATVLTMGCVSLLGLSLLESVAVVRVVNLAGSLAATVVFMVRGELDWTIGAAMSLAAMIGGWVGASVALTWGPRTVRRLLVVTTLMLSGKLVYDACRGWSSPKPATPSQDGR